MKWLIMVYIIPTSLKHATTCLNELELLDGWSKVIENNPHLWEVTYPESIIHDLKMLNYLDKVLYPLLTKHHLEGIEYITRSTVPYVSYKGILLE